MKTVMAGLAVAAALFGAGAAGAQTIHTDGMTGAEVAAWLQKAGYKAALGTDKQGDPVIESAAGGVNFTVYFYDCQNPPRCKAIQFSAGFSLNAPLSLERINEWNRGNRYLKAYADQGGDLHVEYDVNVNAVRTVSGLDDDFAVWIGSLPTFTDFIGW